MSKATSTKLIVSISFFLLCFTGVISVKANQGNSNHAETPISIFVEEEKVHKQWSEVEQVASYPQLHKLLSQTPELSERFGLDVDMSEDTIVIGAFGSNNETGAAYIYQRDQGGVNAWGFVAKLTASDAANGDRFGRSVAISGDIVVVGAYQNSDFGQDSGAVYVFERNQGGINHWGQVKKLLPLDGAPGDRFGWDVSLSGDYLAVGAYWDDVVCCNSGSVYIFEQNVGGNSNWGQVVKLVASDATSNDFFGRATRLDGNTLIVGSQACDTCSTSATGKAYIFERNPNNNSWEQIKILLASDAASGDNFGIDVSIWEDLIVVGASNDDDNGNGSGSAYIFERNLGGVNNWGEVIKITASDGTTLDEYGWGVDIFEDFVVVGAKNGNGFVVDSGSAYVYERNLGGPNNWGESTELIPDEGNPNNQFGFMVSVFNELILVGTPLFDGLAGDDQGAAFLFEQLLPPTALDDSGDEYTTDEDTPFTTGNVFANDTGTPPLSITDVDTSATSGLLTNNGDGTFDYDPNGQFESLSASQQATDTFAYTISNTTGLTDTAFVTITILGLNDTPLIENTDLNLSPAPLNEGETVTLSGTFTDPDTADAHFVTIDWGDGLTDTLALPATTLTFSHTHAYLDDSPSGTPTDAYPILVTIDDGQTSDEAITTLLVNNVAPTLSNVAATSINENGLTTLTGEILDPSPLDTFTLTIDWSDGITVIYTYPAGASSFSETHLYLDDDPTGTPSDVYTLTLTLADDDTGQAETTVPLAVANLTPSLTNLLATPTNENGFTLLTFDLNDPGTLDTFTLTLDWGDGTQENIPYPAGTATIFETHQYLDDNPTGTSQDVYTLTLTLADDDTGLVTTHIAVLVTNLPPQVDAGSDRTVEVATAVQFAGFALDPGSLDTQTIHWDFGDNTTAIGTLTPVHTYFATGIYTVTLTVTDDDGGIGTDTVLVQVNNTGTPTYLIYLPVLSGCPVWYISCLP